MARRSSRRPTEFLTFGARAFPTCAGASGPAAARALARHAVVLRGYDEGEVVHSLDVEDGVDFECIVDDEARLFVAKLIERYQLCESAVVLLGCELVVAT